MVRANYKTEGGGGDLAKVSLKGNGKRYFKCVAVKLTR